MKYLFLLLVSAMSINCKKSQPVSFPNDFDCDMLSDNYCLPVEQGDDTLIYVELTEIDSINLISNGDFATGTGWTTGTDWTIASGVATYAGGMPASNLSRSTNIPLTAGYYKVTLDLVPVSGQVNFVVQLGGVTMSTIGSLVSSGWSAQTISIIAYINPVNNTLSINGANYPFDIDNVTVYKLSEVSYEIRICETGEVVYTDSNNTAIAYYETGDIVNGEDMPDSQTAHAVITINWNTGSMAPLDDDCYCICLKDTGLIGKNFIINGTFSDGSEWAFNNTSDGGWAISSNHGTHTTGTTGGYDYIYQDIDTIDPDVESELTATMVSFGSGTVEILIDSAEGGANESIGTISGSGTFTDTFTITGRSVTRVTFKTYRDQDIYIDNISLYYTFDSLPCACESRCISLKASHDNTLMGVCNYLLTGTNTDEAFGFQFVNPTFQLQGRVFGKIRHGRHQEIDAIWSKNSAAVKKLIFVDVEKTQDLVIYQVPDYAHDWIALILLSDTFTIERNGVTKTFIKVKGDILPNWRNTSSQAPLIVEIQETQQLSPNQYI